MYSKTIKRKACAMAAVTFLLLPIDLMADKHNYNQFASMEYRQWSFSPKNYYYSWFKKKILGISIKVPGLGIHDRGPAGIGIGGDRYVKERWRQLSLLRTAATANHAVETKANKEEDERWNDILKQDMLTMADREVDMAHSITKDERNRLREKIRKSLGLIKDKEMRKNINDELNRIMANIKILKNTDLENAKKLMAYDREKENLSRLMETGQLITLIEATNNIIRRKK